jgi:23S rRNA pseudouridine1911/1915/1917 synthase
MKLIAAPADSGRRLDQFLAASIPDVSRARVQQLISDGQVRVNGARAKASLKLRGGETVAILGSPQAAPLRAMAEDIPLDVVYEDDDLAVVNKPAGMKVHAGAGATDDARNRGTLVNALLHRFRALSGTGGELRPGIVHRLDRETSGLMVIAKNDVAHRKLAEQFAGRKVKKTYVGLVHGWPAQHSGTAFATVDAPIARDPLRRTRMAIRPEEGRSAITHYRVIRRLDSPYGKFALLELRIETGRTHQIRVHMASVGHPIIGDVLYGAPRELKPRREPKTNDRGKVLTLSRNFLHAAAIEFTHPRTGKALAFRQELPRELREWFQVLEGKRPNKR